MNVRDLGKMSQLQAEVTMRRLSQVAYLGDGVVLARVFGALKMFLRTSDVGFAGHVMLDGFWEWWLTSFIAGWVRPGMTVVDVGANFGYYTILMAELVGPDGRVLAIEPAPQTVALLRKTVELNGYSRRTQIIASALAAEPGTGLLWVPDSEPKNANLVGERDIPHGVTVDVPVTSLDEITKDGPRIDFVKIDAEGGEVGVVAGMANLIARDRPAIILEYNPKRYEDPKTFLEVLSDVYGNPVQLGYDAKLHPVDMSAILDRGNLEDRLLVFGIN
jgi:FkbM family methyltransferase